MSVLHLVAVHVHHTGVPPLEKRNAWRALHDTTRQCLFMAVKLLWVSLVRASMCKEMHVLHHRRHTWRVPDNEGQLA
jgi:hypothetical protein